MHRKLIQMLRYTDVRIWYAFVAVFVVPVCLVINPAQKIIYRYFRVHHKMSKLRAFLKTYLNFYCFAQVVIDKFAMYAGKKFEMEVDGYVSYEKLSLQEEGFVQLSAHIGNYEMAGYTLISKAKRFNVLVFGGEKASIMENRDMMFKNTHIHMISIKEDMSHLFEISDALAHHEIVSMPADRFIGSKKMIKISFLGKNTSFPLGPFSVATMRSLDVLAVNVMKTGLRKYRIYVTPLLYDKSAPRKEQERLLATAYVTELEKIVRMYPEQWYNYYEFWNDELD